MVTNISTQDYDMVAQANRKAVSGRRSKAERRGGRQGSGRSAEQLASKIRARRSAGSWTKTGSRPGPLRKKKRLSVLEVDDPAKAAERQAEQERLQRSARVRKRQEERATREVHCLYSYVMPCISARWQIRARRAVSSTRSARGHTKASRLRCKRSRA